MSRGERLDLLMVERGLAPSRARAQSLILAGKVRVEGQPVNKAGTRFGDEVSIEVIAPDHPWVSRGALKLEAAMSAFGLTVDGLDCLDVGASTGGFTELMLARGAARVIALDVGHNQLDWKLRSDPRVTVMEGVNARHLAAGDLPFPVAFATFDLSFISLRLVMPAVLPHLLPGATVVSLVKPQFEAARNEVGKGGIVRDETIRRRVVDQCVADLTALGVELVGTLPSPIRGQKGNLEELAVFRWGELDC